MPRPDDEDEPRRRRRDDYDDEPRRSSGSKDNTGKILLIVFGSLALIGCLGVGGCVALIGFGARQVQREQERERQEAEESRRNPIAVSSTELIAAYKANEVAADKRFKNKWLRVEGTVTRISKHLQVDTKTAEYHVGLQWDALTVNCVFDAAATNEVTKLKVGDAVTVLGRCKGNSFNIELVDCEFVK
jgi:hypothetical protein